ncbi:MAG TPA: hypothetical protein EYP25_13375, partial [Anaerolineae bacterium]|nr:hypothetical protein [Anaerolineae bacterium]
MPFNPFRRAKIDLEDQQRLDRSLEKTRGGILGRLGMLFQANEITEEIWEELEEILIMGDVGVETTMKLVDATRDRVRREGVKKVEDAYQILKEEMVRFLQADAPPLDIDNPHRLLTVVLV